MPPNQPRFCAMPQNIPNICMCRLLRKPTFRPSSETPVFWKTSLTISYPQETYRFLDTPKHLGNNAIIWKQLGNQRGTTPFLVRVYLYIEEYLRVFFIYKKKVWVFFCITEKVKGFLYNEKNERNFLTTKK